MHLLNTETYKIVNVAEEFRATPQYAILSHRWEEKELSFKTLDAAILKGPASPPPEVRLSAEKIKGTCARAKAQGYDFVWIDSCCIDRSSSEELRNAINSMFKWYREAAVCYTYLGDVTFSGRGERMFKNDLALRKKKGEDSVWFERGWTLQELLAPRKMEFYDRTWKPMGTRDSLAQYVGTAARINPQYLTDSGNQSLQFREASVATKMSWMAGRTTTQVEDIAYSLLGILDVYMTPLYGEGIKAFTRLQETLLTDVAAFDESLFAWTLPRLGELKCYRTYQNAPEGSIESIPRFEQSRWGLLAPSPDCFRPPSDVVILRNNIVPRLGSGFQQTHQGVQITLPLKETKNRWTGADRKEIDLTLNCWRAGDSEAATIQLSRDAQRVWMRAVGERLEYKKGAKVGNNRVMGIDQGSVLSMPITVSQPQMRL